MMKLGKQIAIPTLFQFWAEAVAPDWYDADTLGHKMWVPFLEEEVTEMLIDPQDPMAYARTK